MQLQNLAVQEKQHHHMIQCKACASPAWWMQAGVCLTADRRRGTALGRCSGRLLHRAATTRPRHRCCRTAASDGAFGLRAGRCGAAQCPRRHAAALAGGHDGGKHGRGDAVAEGVDAAALAGAGHGARADQQPQGLGRVGCVAEVAPAPRCIAASPSCMPRAAHVGLDACKGCGHDYTMLGM